MAHYNHDNKNYPLGSSEFPHLKVLDRKVSYLSKFGVQESICEEDPVLMLIRGSYTAKHAEGLKQTISQYMLEMTPYDLFKWAYNHQETAKVKMPVLRKVMGLMDDSMPHEEVLRKLRSIVFPYMFSFYMTNIAKLMRDKNKIGMPPGWKPDTSFLSPQWQENTLEIGKSVDDAHAGMLMATHTEGGGSAYVDEADDKDGVLVFPRIFEMNNDELQDLVNYYGDRLYEDMQVPEAVVNQMNVDQLRELLHVFTVQDMLQEIDNVNAGLMDEMAGASIGGTTRMTKSLLYGAGRNVVKKRAPLDGEWDPKLDRAEHVWNGAETPFRRDRAGGTAKNFMLMLHGINANKKPQVWRDQAILMYSGATPTIAKAYVPLVDQNDTLDVVAPKVWMDFRMSDVGREMFDFNLELTQSSVRRRRRDQGNPNKPIFFIIGVSNGGRIATMIELMIRKDNALKNYDIRVLTVASPLAGTGMTSFLPDKLAYKFFSKAYVEEIKAKNQPLTLAKLARMGLSATGDNDNTRRTRTSYAEAQKRNVRYWHITLDEDYLVSRAGGSETDRLVDPGRWTTLSGVSHERAQENPATIDFITNISEARDIPLEQ